MSILPPQQQQQQQQDPSDSLKKYVAERALESVGAVQRLARSAAVGPGRWSQELTSRAGSIKGTREALEQMPLALAAMDAGMDAALEKAAHLAEAKFFLRSSHALASEDKPRE